MHKLYIDKVLHGHGGPETRPGVGAPPHPPTRTVRPPGTVVTHGKGLREVAVLRELGGHADNIVGGVGDAVVRAILRGEVQHLAGVLSAAESCSFAKYPTVPAGGNSVVDPGDLCSLPVADPTGSGSTTMGGMVYVFFHTI